MQSNGGLAEAHGFGGKDAILSGPAGGIVGAARTAAMAGLDRIVGFDMGGTSTDVHSMRAGSSATFETRGRGCAAARADDGDQHRRGRRRLVCISTAPGCGSVRTAPGPIPGPACYRRGGPLTVTDANVCVGKIQPDAFPGDVRAGWRPAAGCRRGAGAGSPRSPSRSRLRPGPGDPRALAEGFLQIAVANMANAIKQISVQKGHDVTRFALACFGGAAGQHACLVADALGMHTVLIHPLAGVLSAYGMGLAEQTAMREQAVEVPLDAASSPRCSGPPTRPPERRRGARRTGRRTRPCSAPSSVCTCATREPMRRSSCAVRRDGRDARELRRASRPGSVSRPRSARSCRIGRRGSVDARRAGRGDIRSRRAAATLRRPAGRVEIFSDGGRTMPRRCSNGPHSAPGDIISGPALISEANATTVVEPGWHAAVTAARRHGAAPYRRRWRQRPPGARGRSGALELFNNLFMNIAEQTGAVLQNTAMSVNIKERLDFSCAVFDADGALVANAPHVPVHLGAMGDSVRSVLRKRARAALKPGDVIALNNPYRRRHASSGHHCYHAGVRRGRDRDIAVLCRLHAATMPMSAAARPGSTPPFSRRLEEEGVVIDDFLLVVGGAFREAEFRALLRMRDTRRAARTPNIADMRAQVAANERGAQELHRAVAAARP